MVNQLWASRAGGAKSFQTGDGIAFGWEAIVGMWDREKERRDQDHIRMVPELIESFIERDAWTKLNVKPAKIMQVLHVYMSNYLPEKSVMRHKYET